MRLESPLDETTVEGTLWLKFPFGAPLDEESGPLRFPWEPLDPGRSPTEGPLAPGSFCLVSPLESPLDDALCATVLPLSARMAL